MQESVSVKVVIVGAGIAGVSAARTLQLSGFTDVHVLESLDRVGGRIYTVKSDKDVLDIGAQFIHGHKGNIVYDIAKTNGLELMSSEESDNSSSGSEGEEKHPSKDDNCKGRVSLFFDSDHWQFVTSNGDFVSGKLVKELMGVYDKISENADLFYDRYVQTKKALEDKGDVPMALDCNMTISESKETGFCSYGEFMDKSFNDYMDTCSDLPDAASIKKAFSKFMFYFECTDSGCNSLYDLSLEGWGKFPNIEGNYNTELKQGYFSVVDVLLKDIPDGVIHLSKPVTCVQWQQNGEVSEIVDDESSSVQSPNSSSEGADENTGKKIKESKLDQKDIQTSNTTQTELDIHDANQNAIPAELYFEGSGISVHKGTVQPVQKQVDASPNIKPEENSFEDTESNSKTEIGSSAGVGGRAISRHKHQNSGNSDTSSNTETRNLAGIHVSPKTKLENQYSGNSESTSNPGIRKMVEDGVKAEPKHGSPRAVILCDDGTKYEADHVIVTPSLGFLKSNHLKFFSPPLPAHRQLMIENAGFGVVDKVFLVWEEPFWDMDFAGWQFLWLDDCPVHVPSAKTCLKTSTGLNWYENCVGFETMHTPNTLLGWFSSEHAELMERVPEEEVRGVCVELLRHFLKKDIPKPKQIIRSQWKGNKYIQGSYSFVSTGPTSMEDHDLLGQPLPSTEDPVLLFAGEAYSSHHFSTVRGAVQSGEEAARTIINVHNKQRGET